MLVREMVRARAVCILSLLLAGGNRALAAATGAAEEPVVFVLSRAQARAGDTVSLYLSVKTKLTLRSISIALDFDESRVRALDFRRLGSPDAPIATAPDDLTSTVVSNTDAEKGNQTGEGWIHLQFDAPTDAALKIPEGAEVRLVELRFLVLRGASPGFSPIQFVKVGPADAAPAPPFDNDVEAAAPAPPLRQDLPAAALEDGGIDIIGEVGFFMRGDANFDLRRDISDPIICLTYLFTGGVAMPCADAGDANDDGVLDVSDPIYTLEHLFESPEPFPDPDSWGRDPTPDDLGCRASR